MKIPVYYISVELDNGIVINKRVSARSILHACASLTSRKVVATKPSSKNS